MYMILSRLEPPSNNALDLVDVGRMHPSVVPTPNTNYSSSLMHLVTGYYVNSPLNLYITMSLMHYPHKLSLIGSIRYCA